MLCIVNNVANCHWLQPWDCSRAKPFIGYSVMVDRPFNYWWDLDPLKIGLGTGGYEMRLGKVCNFGLVKIFG